MYVIALQGKRAFIQRPYRRTLCYGSSPLLILESCNIWKVGTRENSTRKLTQFPCLRCLIMLLLLCVCLAWSGRLYGNGSMVIRHCLWQLWMAWFIVRSGFLVWVDEIIWTFIIFHGTEMTLWGIWAEGLCSPSNEPKNWWYSHWIYSKFPSV